MMKFIQSTRGCRVIFHSPIKVRSSGSFTTNIKIVQDMTHPGESISYWKAQLDDGHGYCDIRDEQKYFCLGDRLEGSIHLDKGNFIHIKVP